MSNGGSMSPVNGDEEPGGADEHPGPNDGLLVVKELTKQFGGLTAVDQLSLTVSEGEILGFIGPNGAGKSTTFNCIMGWHKPTAGSVWFNGSDITNKPAHEIVQRGVSSTFQTFKSLGDRSVLDNVAIALVPDRVISFSGLAGHPRERAAEICERVGLGNSLQQTPAELPHAGLLRLELARAIATDPDLILIDEPLAGLSMKEVEDVTDLCAQLRDEGLTLVVIDHNMRGLLTLIDRAIVIQYGSKIAEGTAEEIREDPRVREAYLGSERV